MALVDKHKVKRQRLDKICEGESPFTPLFLGGVYLDFRWWLHILRSLEMDYAAPTCYFE